MVLKVSRLGQWLIAVVDPRRSLDRVPLRPGLEFFLDNLSGVSMPQEIL
jgi:hypothetical protein